MTQISQTLLQKIMRPGNMHPIDKQLWTRRYSKQAIINYISHVFLFYYFEYYYLVLIYTLFLNCLPEYNHISHI